MKRFLLLLVVAIAALPALHATPIAFASCTLGDTTQEETATGFASCSLFGEGPNLLVFFRSSIDESIFANALSVSAEIGGVVNNNNLGGLFGRSRGSATDNLTLVTPGPRRSGIIHFSHGGFGISSIDGIDLVGQEAGSASFELGAPFEFSFQVDWACFDHVCPGAASGVSFELFEADGVTPVLISTVPEPASCGLVLFGLGLCGWFRVRHGGSGTQSDARYVPGAEQIETEG